MSFLKQVSLLFSFFLWPLIFYEFKLVFSQDIYNLSSCTTITSPGKYVINESIISAGSSTKKCIIINVSDVFIDGNGSLINFSFGSPTGSIGVFINSSEELKNITIKNLTIRNFQYGIYVNTSLANFTLENTLMNVSHYSLIVSNNTGYIKDFYISMNSIISNLKNGIKVNSSTSNVSSITIINNTINAYLTSISMNASNISNVSIKDNNVSSQWENGIIISGSSGLNILASGNNISSNLETVYLLDFTLIDNVSLLNNNLTSLTEGCLKIDTINGSNMTIKKNSFTCIFADDNEGNINFYYSNLSGLSVLNNFLLPSGAFYSKTGLVFNNTDVSFGYIAFNSITTESDNIVFFSSSLEFFNITGNIFNSTLGNTMKAIEGNLKNLVIELNNISSSSGFLFLKNNGSSIIINDNNMETNNSINFINGSFNNVFIKNNSINSLRGCEICFINLTELLNLSVEMNFVNASYIGIFISSEKADNLSLSNNVINNVSAQAISIVSSNGFLIENLTIEKNIIDTLENFNNSVLAIAIFIGNGKNIKVNENNISNVKGNYSGSFSSFGIFLENATNISIVGNSLKNISSLEKEAASIFVSSSNNTFISNNLIFGDQNSFGLVLSNSNNVSSNNIYLANNKGLLIENKQSLENLTNFSLSVIFDNPLGGFINYSNITLRIDFIEPGNKTTISWAETPYMPSYNSFHNKSIEINSTNVTINELTFYYTDEEDEAMAGSNGKSILQIWKFNGTDWINLSSNQSITERKVSLYNFTAGSIYSLLFTGVFISERESEKKKELFIETDFICPYNFLKVIIKDKNNETLQGAQVSLFSDFYNEIKETNNNGVAVFKINKTGFYNIKASKVAYKESRIALIINELCRKQEEKQTESYGYGPSSYEPEVIIESEKRENKTIEEEIERLEKEIKKVERLVIKAPEEAYVEDNITIYVKWENNTIASGILIKVYYNNKFISLITDVNGKASFIASEEGVYVYSSDYILASSVKTIVKKREKKILSKEEVAIKEGFKKEKGNEIELIVVSFLFILLFLIPFLILLLIRHLTRKLKLEKEKE